MKIKDLIGHNVNDIMTLSDLQTIAQYDAVDGVDFTIEEVRIYHEPSDLFTYTGYIGTTPDDDHKYMLLIRQVDDVADLLLFYLDQEGDASDYYDAVIKEEGDDFEQNFEIEIDDEDVKWIKKSATFGVEIEVNGEEGQPLTLGEFGTNSEINNPIAFLEWSGTDDDEYLEIWYGCSVKENEVEILSIK